MKMTTFWENERRKLLGQPLLADDDTQANTAIDAPQAAVLQQAEEQEDIFILPSPFAITEEEKKASKVSLKGGKNAEMQKLIDSFETMVANSKDETEIELHVISYSKKIFQQAWVDSNDSGLYIARSKMRIALRSGYDSFAKTKIAVTNYLKSQTWIQLIEDNSRNYANIDFSSDLAHTDLKILMTGFDPFENAKTNFSGELALEFHNKIISGATKTARIQSVIFPVRYQEFDNGFVDNFFAKWIPQVDAILTCSLYQRDTHLSIERFAGNWRQADKDNNDYEYTSGQSIVISGRAFYESTLPVDKLLLASEVNLTNFIRYREDYQTQVMPKPFTKKDTNQPSFPLSNIFGQAKEGSGGAFLSNELFYRVARLRQMMRPSLPTGHIHVPIKSKNHVQSFKILLDRLVDAL
jgi:pyrrolidone-carboxylate peptidase